MTLDDQSIAAFDRNETPSVFSLANDNWPAIGEELPAGIGEACRHAFIRHAEAHHIDQHLWRARAMTAAVLTGARDTAAGLLIQAAFLAINDANEGRSEGRERGYEQARMILEEMKRLVPEDYPTWLQPWARLYHDKRAYSFLEEGTGGSRASTAGQQWLTSAEDEYELALKHTREDEKRGRLKVLGGLALVRYLRLADKPAEEIAEAKKPFLEETRAIGEAAAAAGYRDVEGWAGANVSVMERGEFVGWSPYEVE